MSSREAVETNFHSFWFDPIVNWTRVYCFNNRRSIHSTTDRLNYDLPGFELYICVSVLHRCWQYDPKARPTFKRLHSKFRQDPEYFNIKVPGHAPHWWLFHFFYCKAHLLTHCWFFNFVTTSAKNLFASLWGHLVLCFNCYFLPGLMQKLFVTNSNTFEILSKRFLSLILRQMMTLFRKNLFFA